MQEGEWERIESNEQVLSARDNGIGIEPQRLDRIFLIFQQFHKQTKCGGTGTRPTTVKKIIERRRGGIWVESRAGKGSTSYLTTRARETRA